MAVNSQKRNRKVANEKGFFSVESLRKIYDKISDAPEEVSNWWEKSDLKKSLMPGLDKELANQDYANTPLNRLPENKKGEQTKAAFLKKRKDKKDKTAKGLAVSKKRRAKVIAARKARKEKEALVDKAKDNAQTTDLLNEGFLKENPAKENINKALDNANFQGKRENAKLTLMDDSKPAWHQSKLNAEEHLKNNPRLEPQIEPDNFLRDDEKKARMSESWKGSGKVKNDISPPVKKADNMPPKPQPKKEPSFPAPVDDFTNTGDLEDEQLEATEFAKLRAENKPVMAEDILKNKNKEQTARIKESTGDWYIDPFTGFALDLGKLEKLQNRKKILEVAGMLPANRRASYLAQNELISESDLKKMLDPTEKEILDLQIKQNTIDKQGLELVLGKKKLDDYEDPRKKELRGQYGDFYKTAVKEGNTDSQIYWLNKMELPPEEIKKLSDNIAKASKLPKDVGKYWDSKYAIKWGQVVTLKKSLIDTAGKAFIDGAMGFEMGGKTYSSREEYYKNEGLMPHAEVLALGERAKSDENAKQQLKSYFNQLAIKPSGGLERLMDEDNYQQYMYENFLYRGMGTLLGGEDIYGKMIAEYRQIINPVGLTEKITAKQ